MSFVPGGPYVIPILLRERLAKLYGVSPECLLPILGTGYPLRAVVRSLEQDWFDKAAGHLVDRELFEDDSGREVRFFFSPTIEEGRLVTVADLPDDLTYVDETAIEYADAGEAASLARVAATSSRLFVYRNLGRVYGINDTAVGAVISTPQRIRGLELIASENPLPGPVVQLAESAVSVTRMMRTRCRIESVRAERARLAAALGCAAGQGDWLVLDGADPLRFAAHGVQVHWLQGRNARLGLSPREADRARVQVGTPEENDLVLAAMGVAVPPRPPARTAEVVRDTRETNIVCAVDLDRAEPVRIATGVPFYDHMLEQIAKHGGFSLILSAQGDLHIEAHHTIEDCALALGEALRQALGDKAGVARFGFVAPLDEAEAAVTLDLSGRPLAKFTGAFARPMIGAFPTEMTPHVFRSIADSLRATIHVRVEGEDDHHKTEACFKAFGRALRMAVRREGDGVPSTKGVLG